MTPLRFVNANIITMDPTLPRAQQIIVDNGKIAFVSDNESSKDYCGVKSSVIDCQGMTIVPGFIDAHCHFMSLAESLVTLDLGPSKVRSIADIRSLIQETARTLAPGTWIKGRGYNEFSLTEKRHPTRWDLDAAAPVHPVRITHRSGHAHLLNSLALQLVGISDETGDPPGGLINRDIQTGLPTGLLFGMGEILTRFIPPMSDDQVDHGIRLAAQMLSAQGITSFHDVSFRNGLNRLALLSSWRQRGFLPQRANMTLGWEEFQKLTKHESTAFRSDDHVRIQGVKIIIHETTGQLSPSQTELNEMVLRIHQDGYQAILHAMEENTIAAACKAIENALKTNPRTDHRHRIEHCSICTPALANRIASAGIIVVTQPGFLYYNGERYLRTVSKEDQRYLYPIGTLKKHGVKVAGSSDCPVVPANPLMGIYAAVSRRAENGECLLSEEKITPHEAIGLFTSGAALATFTETTRGSIQPGMLADLVVLSDDPTILSHDAIKDIKIEKTIVGGQVFWERHCSPSEPSH